ncbi:hypothetical protein K435DRAFT_779113 [Dendrothele bispora CBS 962.96]|uniref:FAD-binding FR-type domain-containing protein n=1 Tax=Dendrothele bispora (strain CBS 962.96) TaxID=1314807 RepID=A0A4S8LZN1_DENBC|nr:hypothetical protein K435DRAFT_779113 [Dendrothele bispora CBS 962.96]
MTDHGTPPSIPTEFQLYNSYVEDPKWQTKFSIIWAALVAGAVLYSFPRFAKSVLNGKAFVGFWGLREQWGIDSDRDRNRTTGGRSNERVRNGSSLGSFLSGLQGPFSIVRSMFLWTLPVLRWNLGHLIVVVGYLVIVLICLTNGSQLASNSNRAGFLAIAQLPPLYLFATKNSVLTFLLGPGTSYHSLNPIHRLIGFSLLLCAFIHGSLWISNHLIWHLPILSQQKEASGVAALGCIGVLGVTSVRFVREGSVFRFLSRLPLLKKTRAPGVSRTLETLAGCSYEWFWAVHMLVSTAFFVTVCYHTIYAPPWIFPPLAFLGMDLFMRMWRLRMKDALVWGVDGGMSVIRIPDVTSGWTAGQHVRLRVFFGGGRVFESHPLTIANAPRDTSCLTLGYHDERDIHPNLGFDASGPGIILGARVNGDWTKALNEYVNAEKDRLIAEAQTRLREEEEAQAEAEAEKNSNEPMTTADVLNTTNLGPWEVPVDTLVSIDGPYGGSSVDLGEYETVLLVSGGSGATFTIGLLDDLVGRVARGRRGGERTKRIEFVWCVKGFGCISWFAPLLHSIALAAASTLTSANPLHLHLSIYVTCLCSPENLLDIPNMDVTITPRPDVGRILRALVEPSTTTATLEDGTTVIPTVSKDAPNCCVAPGVPGATQDKEPTDIDSDSGSVVETSRVRPTSSSSSSLSELELEKSKSNEIDLEFGPAVLIPCKLPRIPLGGGVGVCASGPESLTRETSNAVARLGVTSAGRLGKVAVHTEVFKI